MSRADQRRHRRKQAAESTPVAPKVQVAEGPAAHNDPAPPQNGGRGEDEIHLTPVQANKIYGKYIHGDRDKWPRQEKHDLAAIGVTARNMGHEDGRVSNGAVRNYIAMRAQDQRVNEIMAGIIAPPPAAVNINNSGPLVLNILEQVVERRADQVSDSPDPAAISA